VFEVSEAAELCHTVLLTPEKLIALGTELVIMGIGKTLKE
jgi:hypothetical protein